MDMSEAYNPAIGLTLSQVREFLPKHVPLAPIILKSMIIPGLLILYRIIQKFLRPPPESVDKSKKKAKNMISLLFQVSVLFYISFNFFWYLANWKINRDWLVWGNWPFPAIPIRLIDKHPG